MVDGTRGRSGDEKSTKLALMLLSSVIAGTFVYALFEDNCHALIILDPGTFWRVIFVGFL